MLKLSGYQIIDQIYESSNSLIYRGYREADKQPVILKTLRDSYPSPERIACYQREYDITHNLHFPGVVQVYACETHQHCYQLSDEFPESCLSTSRIRAVAD